jgi:hypothetical protein
LKRKDMKLYSKEKNIFMEIWNYFNWLGISFSRKLKEQF